MNKKALLTTAILTALAANVCAADIVLKNTDNADSNHNLVSRVLVISMWILLHLKILIIM